jgi:hypothetical protein
MLDNFDSYDAGFAWDRALRKTYAHTDTSFTARESEIAAAVNRAVSQATPRSETATAWPRSPTSKQPSPSHSGWSSPSTTYALIDRARIHAGAGSRNQRTIT